MENFVEIATCRICLSRVARENCDIIDQHGRDILEILLPKWTLDEGKHLICKDCSTKLSAALDFKGICADTEDSIFPYVNSERGGSLDLREIYITENNSKKSISEIQIVCRLCMHLIFGALISLEQLDVNMLNTFIPEINFSSTKNPVICEGCYAAFKLHSVFLMNCLENKNEIKRVNEGISYFKSEEVDLKPVEVNLEFKENDKSDLEEAAHETEEECNFDFGNKEKPNLKRRLLMYKEKVHMDLSEIKMYKCENCSFKTMYKQNVRVHKLKHKDPSEIQMYKCDKCSYETRHKRYLQSHMLVHRDPSNVQMYKCEECSFKTMYKQNVRVHKLKHKDPSEIQMYKCDECIYETRFKFHLQVHKRVHRDPSKIQMYNCDECSYKTRQKRHLQSHMPVHRDPSNVQMYKCEECSFQTRHKGNLHKHKLKHKDPSEIQMYKCDECIYETRVKFHLQVHKRVHRDPSKIQMYNCDKCSYKTRQKRHLQSHMPVHRDPSDIQMYKCEECSFQTRQKRSLRQHKLNHRDPEMYKCNDCSYTTRDERLVHSRASAQRSLQGTDIQMRQW